MIHTDQLEPDHRENRDCEEQKLEDGHWLGH